MIVLSVSKVLEDKCCGGIYSVVFESQSKKRLKSNRVIAVTSTHW